MEAENIEGNIGELVAEQVRVQLLKDLHRIGPVHLCGSCDKKTNNDFEVCRNCQAAGNEASVLHQLGRRMGFRSGVPTDLLEVLDRPEEELLSMTADELAELWDANTQLYVPTRVKVQYEEQKIPYQVPPTPAARLRGLRTVEERQAEQLLFQQEYSEWQAQQKETPDLRLQLVGPRPRPKTVKEREQELDIQEASLVEEENKKIQVRLKRAESELARAQQHLESLGRR